MSRLAQLLLVPLVGAGSVFAQNTFQIIEDFPGGGQQIVATDVSADGTIVVGSGEKEDPTGETRGDTRPFRWTAAGGLVDLGTLSGGTEAGANAASADGNIVGGQGNSGLLFRTGFRSVQGQPFLDFIFNPSSGILRPTSDVLGISDDGTVLVGFGRETSDSSPRAYRWSEVNGVGVFETLGPVLPGTNRNDGEEFSWAADTNTDGTILVGYANSALADNIEGYHWDTNTDTLTRLGFYPGARQKDSRPSAVTPDGVTVVGWVYTGNTDNGDVADGEEAFRWTIGGGFERLGFLAISGDDYRSHAEAVSADGNVVVGMSWNENGDERAFVWDSQNGMRDLKTALNLPNEIGDFVLLSANGISDDGRVIVGEGAFPSAISDEFAFIARLEPSVGVDAEQALAEADFELDSAASASAGAVVVTFRLNETYTNLVYRLRTAGTLPGTPVAFQEFTPQGSGNGFLAEPMRGVTSAADGAWQTLSVTIPLDASGFGSERGFVFLEIESSN